MTSPSTYERLLERPEPLWRKPSIEPGDLLVFRQEHYDCDAAEGDVFLVLTPIVWTPCAYHSTNSGWTTTALDLRTCCATDILWSVTNGAATWKIIKYGG